MKKGVAAIIGGGPAGQTLLQSFKSRGYQTHLFEKKPSSGGLWSLDDPGVWQGIEVNISRFHMRYPNFSWNKDMPHFPNGRQYLKYLEKHIEHFQLAPHIHYNQTVTSISQHKADKRYLLQLNGKEIFDADIAVNTNGFFNKRHIPKVLEQEKLKKPVIHSKDYQDGNEYAGKTVIVVGSGMSALEICCDLVKKGAKVINVGNSNTWIVKRTIDGIPFDMLSYNYISPDGKAPEEAAKIQYIKNVFGNPGDIHQALHINENSPLKVAVSDDYLDFVAAGMITPYRHNPIKDVFEDGIVLESGERIACDTIIACTGSGTDLSIFENDMLNAMNYDPNDNVMPAILPFGSFVPGYNGLYNLAGEKGSWMAKTYLRGEEIASFEAGEASYSYQEQMHNAWKAEMEIRRKKPQFTYNYPKDLMQIAHRTGRAPVDLLEEAKTSKTIRICPADFLRCGPHADFEYAEQERKIHLEVMKHNG